MRSTMDHYDVTRSARKEGGEDVGEAQEEEAEVVIEHLPTWVWWCAVLVKLLLIIIAVLGSSILIVIAGSFLDSALRKQNMYDENQHCTVVDEPRFYTWAPEGNQQTMHGFVVEVIFPDLAISTANQSDWRTISPAVSKDYVKKHYAKGTVHSCFVSRPSASLPSDPFWQHVMFSLPQDYDITISVMFFACSLLISILIGSITPFVILFLDRWDTSTLAKLSEFLTITDEGSRLRYTNWYLGISGLDLFTMLGMWPFLAAAILWNSGLYDCMVCLWPVVVLIVSSFVSYVVCFWATSGRRLHVLAAITSGNSQMSVFAIVAWLYFIYRISSSRDLQWVYSAMLVFWSPYVVAKLSQIYFFVRGMSLQWTDSPSKYLSDGAHSIVVKRGAALGMLGSLFILLPYIISVASFLSTYILLHVSEDTFYAISIWTVPASFAPYIAFAGSVGSSREVRKVVLIGSTALLSLIALEALIAFIIFMVMFPQNYYRIPGAATIMVGALTMGAVVTFLFGMRDFAIKTDDEESVPILDAVEGKME